MEKPSIGQIILLIFAGSVCIVLVTSILGIVFRGSENPSEASVAIRTALIDLLKVITGGVLGAIATSKNNNK